MKIKIIEPTTSEEFKKYYNLRYEILRKPWGEPPGSERDEGEETSIHRMIIDNKTGNALAVGRLQFNSEDEAQIRYMAVADDLQGKGLGSQIISSLEHIAWRHGNKWMILSARPARCSLDSHLTAVAAMTTSSIRCRSGTITAQFVFVDGSVQFLSENIDYITYQRLGDRRDGEPLPDEWNTNY